MPHDDLNHWRLASISVISAIGTANAAAAIRVSDLSGDAGADDDEVVLFYHCSTGFIRSADDTFDTLSLARYLLEKIRLLGSQPRAVHTNYVRVAADVCGATGIL